MKLLAGPEAEPLAFQFWEQGMERGTNFGRGRWGHVAINQVLAVKLDKSVTIRFGRGQGVLVPTGERVESRSFRPRTAE